MTIEQIKKKIDYCSFKGKDWEGSNVIVVEKELVFKLLDELAGKTDSIDLVSNAERTFCTCGNPSGEGNIKMINNEYLLYFCSDCGKQAQNDC